MSVPLLWFSTLNKELVVNILWNYKYTTHGHISLIRLSPWRSEGTGRCLRNKHIWGWRFKVVCFAIRWTLDLTWKIVYYLYILDKAHSEGRLVLYIRTERWNRYASFLEKKRTCLWPAQGSCKVRLGDSNRRPFGPKLSISPLSHRYWSTVHSINWHGSMLLNKISCIQRWVLSQIFFQ